jgi:hypothetical protein
VRLDGVAVLDQAFDAAQRCGAVKQLELADYGERLGAPP